jgi:hypothetical protein
MLYLLVSPPLGDHGADSSNRSYRLLNLLATMAILGFVLAGAVFIQKLDERKARLIMQVNNKGTREGSHSR